MTLPTRAYDRVRIYPSSYCGVQGFTVQPLNGQRGGYAIHLFTKTRASAELIKARLKAGEEITFADWNAA